MQHCIRWLTRPWRTRNTSIGARGVKRICKPPVQPDRSEILREDPVGLIAEGFVMRRYYTQLSRKTWFMLLALGAAGTAWLGYSCLGSSREPHAKHHAALLLQSLAAASEYQIQDAKVLDESKPAAAAEQEKTD